jgi:hypothetical protein
MKTSTLEAAIVSGLELGLYITCLLTRSTEPVIEALPPSPGVLTQEVKANEVVNNKVVNI